MHHCLTKALATVTAAAITLLPAGSAFAGDGGTATPIKHVVVIFQENVSFDHYFGTYPKAAKADACSTSPVFTGRWPFNAKAIK